MQDQNDVAAGLSCPSIFLALERAIAETASDPNYNGYLRNYELALKVGQPSGQTDRTDCLHRLTDSNAPFQVVPYGYHKAQVDAVLKKLAKRNADGSPGTLVLVPGAVPRVVRPYPSVPGFKGSLVLYTLNWQSPFGRTV